MPSLLILRPEPGASATAARARALGLEPLCIPLFTVAALDWPPADPDIYDAVMMTSAQAAELGGPLLIAYTHLPLYAVGAATATAARAAGFTSIHTGAGGVEALLEEMRDHGVGRILHLAGEHHRVPAAGWMSIDRRIVYSAQEVSPPPQLPDAPLILVHSPRAAERLAEIISPEVRAARHIIAISAAAAAATGTGWASLQIAAEPNDASLLACAADVCKAL